MSQTKAQLISDLVQALNFTGTASAPTNGAFLSATNTLALATNSVQRLTIDSTGRVVIGNTTVTDNAKFQQYGTSARYQSFQSTNGDLAIVTDNNSNPALYIKGTGTADLVNIFDNTTEVFTILDGGNVGIGETSPAANLHVKEGDSGTTPDSNRDTLFIETSSFFVIEKTTYKDREFISPRTFTNSLTINTNFFDKISNRLKVGNDVFYCRLVRQQVDGQPYSNNVLYPEIYKYSYIDEEVTKLFPTTTNSVDSSALYFNLSTVDNIYIESGKPILTYSSDNEQFNLGVLLKDQNQGPLLVNYLFEYTNDINFLNSETFVNTTSKYTADFVSSSGTIDTFTFHPSLTAGVTNFPSIIIGTSALGPNLSAASLRL